MMQRRNRPTGTAARFWDFHTRLTALIINGATGLCSYSVSLNLNLILELVTVFVKLRRDRLHYHLTEPGLHFSFFLALGLVE
jgi:hypothetical protein